MKETSDEGQEPDAHVRRLLGGTKDSDPETRGWAAGRLGRLGARLSAESLGTVTERLLELTRDPTSYTVLNLGRRDLHHVRGDAAEALGDLGHRLPEACLEAVTERLLELTLDAKHPVREKGAKALGSLGARLPEGHLDRVADRLRKITKDASGNADVWATRALGNPASSGPPRSPP